MQIMIAKVFSKVFALDGRSSAVEYGVIAAVVVTALLSTLLAMSDSLASIYQAMIGPARTL